MSCQIHAQAARLCAISSSSDNPLGSWSRASMADIHQVTYVYKLVHPSTPPPDPLPASLPLSELDVQSGFIHLSTARQVPGTLRLFFTNEPRMYVLRIPIKAIEKDLRWEAPSVPVSGDGDAASTFPHLYNVTLGSAEVESVALWEKGEGTWDNVLGTEEVTSWLLD